MNPEAIVFVRMALLWLLVGSGLGAHMMWVRAGIHISHGGAGDGMTHAAVMGVGFMTQFALGVGHWILPKWGRNQYRGRRLPVYAAAGLLNLGVALVVLGHVPAGASAMGIAVLLLIAVHAPRVRAVGAVALLLCAVPWSRMALAQSAGADIYQRECAACHGADRLGAMGPVLIPDNLARLKKMQAMETVIYGRVATTMPAFGQRLSPADISAVVDWIYTTPATAPVWGAVQIVQSRTDGSPLVPAGQGHKGLPKNSDPLNLFVVVEAGDQHVSIVDGDNLTVLARFPSRFALHGGPKFSPDGRYVYFGSRDGYVTKYDLQTLAVVAEVRASISLRNVALSPDGKWVFAANQVPASIVVMDASNLGLVQVFEPRSASGAVSRVSAVYQAAPRGSLIAALRDAPELLEFSVPSDGRKPFYALGPLSEERLLAGMVDRVRRIGLPRPMDDFFFAPGYASVIGSSRAGGTSVVDLATGQVVAELPIAGMPHLASGISWQVAGRRQLATPNLGKPLLTVIDPADWRVVTEVTTDGPGFFLRSHENLPVAWADAAMGPSRDTIMVVDKASGKITRRLTPVVGKVANHVEFDRYGKYALVSVSELDGEIVVYDTRSYAVVKRLPMSKPVGKYNVYNKTRGSEGTSH